MILRRVHPLPSDAADAVDLDADGARDLVSQWYRPPRADWLRINLVEGVGGSAAGADGTSKGLSSRTDRLVLGVIRELSDVVLVGAQSVRAEGYVMPRRADLAIVTTTGDFGDRGLRERRGAGRLLVVCPPVAGRRVRAGGVERDELILVEPETHGRLDPAAVVAALRERGHRSIVCEGGPSLAAQLVQCHLVDELSLTTSPRISPIALPLLGDEELPASELRLAQLLLDEDSAIYARWMFDRG